LIADLVAKVRGASKGSSHPRDLACQLQVRQTGLFYKEKGRVMKVKEKRPQTIQQPKPFTPGITASMVRQHAYEMYRDKLPDKPLTVEDWVLAEKDLVSSLEDNDLPK
jgi:hypothetical protein